MAGALQALHKGSEHHVIKILDSANLYAIHARRITVMPKDIQLAGKLLELDQNYKTSEIVTGAAGRNARGVAVTEDRRGGMNSRRGGNSSNSRQTSDNDNDEDGGSGGRSIGGSSHKRRGDSCKSRKTSENDDDDEDVGSGGKGIAGSSRKRKDEKGDDRKSKKYKLEERKRAQ